MSHYWFSTTRIFRNIDGPAEEVEERFEFHTLIMEYSPLALQTFLCVRRGRGFSLVIRRIRRVREKLKHRVNSRQQ